MTANKSSKATARAGGGKAARDVSDRSVTSGTERVRESGGGGLSLFSHVLPAGHRRSVCSV